MTDFTISWNKHEFYIQFFYEISFFDLDLQKCYIITSLWEGNMMMKKGEIWHILV